MRHIFGPSLVAIAHGHHCPICVVHPLFFRAISRTDLRIAQATIRSNSKHALNGEIARASWSGSFGPPAALRGAEETPDPPGDPCRCVWDVLTSCRRSLKVTGHAETSVPHGSSAAHPPVELVVPRSGSQVPVGNSTPSSKTPEPQVAASAGYCGSPTQPTTSTFSKA